jgi:P4 family phage/plasmid primase-like protien
MNQAAEVAAAYRSMGWATIRVYPCAKNPIGDGWEVRIDEPDVFQPSDNIGVRLGTPSGGLVDVDLDCMEAVKLAPLFLPATATFGRASKPRSHWLYRCATTTLKPPRTAVELRSTGGQTVFPGSTHVSGEAIVWDDWPTSGALEISEVDLLTAWGSLSLATVLARCWPEAQRTHDGHHVGLAVAGALWHAGWTRENAERVIMGAASFLDSTSTVEALIADTFEEHSRNRFGWPTLAELIGSKDATAMERMAELVPTIPRSVVAAASAAASAGAGAGAGAGAFTDLGNAERFMDEHGVRSIRKLGRQGLEQGNALALKWATRSESAGGLTAVGTIAAKLDTRTEADQLDADPWILNARNGIVDLRTGVLRPHERERLCTKVAGTYYDPAATCPRFMRFLTEIFQGDLDLVAYMLRYLGSSLSGVIRDQVFQLWYGTGSNGKSTLVEVMLHVLGDYAQKMAAELLTSATRSSAAASPDVVRLRGVRFTAGVETAEGQRWNEVLVKELTGGDRIVARKLHHEPIEFRPTWKMAMAVNHRPVVRGTDHGIWRRIHLIPFLQMFEGLSKDPGLLDYLRDHEAPGILALLVRGCMEWAASGLNPPASVLAAVAEYREGQDTIGAFLGECTRPEDAATAGRSELYRAYRNWCVEGGEFCHGKQTLSRIIQERGHTLRKGGGVHQWVGIRLLSTNF